MPKEPKKTSRLSASTKKSVMKAKKSGNLTGSQAKALRATLRTTGIQKKGSKTPGVAAGSVGPKKLKQGERKLIKLSGIKKSVIKSQTKRTNAQTAKAAAASATTAAKAKASGRGQNTATPKRVGGSASVGTQTRVAGLAFGPASTPSQARTKAQAQKAAIKARRRRRKSHK